VLKLGAYWLTGSLALYSDALESIINVVAAGAAFIALRVASMPADDWRRNSVEFKEPRLSRNLQLVELLREIGSEHGVNPGVVAVAWTLHHPAITAAIVGGRSGNQVEEIAPALEFRLGTEEYERINAFLAQDAG